MSDNWLGRSKKAKYKVDNGESQEITHKIPKCIEIGSARYRIEIGKGREKVKTEKQELIESLFKKVLYSQVSNLTQISSQYVEDLS